MHSLRGALFLTLVYGGVQLAAGLFDIWRSGDESEILRTSLRVAICGIVAYGLWKMTKWGWWIGMIYSGAAVLFNIIALLLGFLFGSRAGQPYWPIEVFISVVNVGIMGGTLWYLLQPASRQMVRESDKPAESRGQLYFS